MLWIWGKYVLSWIWEWHIISLMNLYPLWNMHTNSKCGDWISNWIKLSIKSPKVVTNVRILMNSPIFSTSKTCASDLKTKLKKKVVLWILGQTHFEKILSSFLNLNLNKKYTSGERRKEMHVHVDGKENGKVLSYIKIKYGWH